MAPNYYNSFRYGVDSMFLDAPHVPTIAVKQTKLRELLGLPASLAPMPKSNFKEIICLMYDNSI